MNLSPILSFLQELNTHNSKSWMDKHRDVYEQTKQTRIDEIQKIYDRLATHDPYFETADPSDHIERINNNLLYHPEKPTYKDHFWATILWSKDFGLYVKVWLTNSFVWAWAHGIWSQKLKQIRKAIDTRGDELKQIIHAPEFVQFYGWLPEDPHALKTAPRWRSTDHPHIDLLRRKEFAVMHPLTQEQITGDSFVDTIEHAYTISQPLLEFLDTATS